MLPHYFWYLFCLKDFIFSEKGVCCGYLGLHEPDLNICWYSVCVRWSLFRWCMEKDILHDNRRLSSCLALTGSLCYLNWVVFPTNLSKDKSGSNVWKDYKTTKGRAMSFRKSAIRLNMHVWSKRPDFGPWRQRLQIVKMTGDDFLQAMNKFIALSQPDVQIQVKS